MRNTIQFAACLLLSVAGAFAQAAKGNPVLRPNLKGGGLPKGIPKAFPKGIPKGGPRINNPGSPAARLYRASPEQRERVLEKLPPNQQERMRQELKWFDGLPKDQQDQVIERSERLAALTPEKQRAVQHQMQALNRLSPERRRAVRQVLLRLQGLPEEERTGILSGDRFRGQYSAEELQIIADLAAVMPPPR